MPRKPSRHVDDPVKVGERLRAARLAAGLSQRDLSFDGCTAAYVSRIEAGARTPSKQILESFAERIGTTAEWLAWGRQEQTPPPTQLDQAHAYLDKLALLYEEGVQRDEVANGVIDMLEKLIDEREWQLVREQIRTERAAEMRARGVSEETIEKAIEEELERLDNSSAPVDA